MKISNRTMELMLISLKPILVQRNKIGYVAARNARILSDALTEYFKFKNELINKYGEVDVDENGNELQTISLKINSPNFEKAKKELEMYESIEQDVSLMTVKYEEAIDILSGEEILSVEWIFEK